MEKENSHDFISKDDRLVYDIIKLIKAQKLNTGDKLESIRALAERFDCTQSQIRSALLRAEAFGFVTIQPRSGCYVRNLSLDSLLQVFCLLFDSTAEANEMALVEIYEVKTALDTAVAKIVAKIRTESELLVLKSIISQQEAATDIQEMIELDEKFHLFMAQISRNDFFKSLIAVLNSMLRTARKNYTDYTETYIQIINDHKLIYEAIKARDSDKAYEYANIHANRRKDKLLSYC